MPERASAAAALPSPPDLLRAALEKIVFFEWRLSELAAELSAAQSRCASAELERARADELSRSSQQQAQAARLQLAELEAERARLASLLARPAHVAPMADLQALEAERERCARLEAELGDLRRALALQKDERARWLNEMIAQAQSGDDAPAALAQFISELRGEVIALRERQRQCDALLTGAGLSPPPPAAIEPPAALPEREPEPVETARQLWAEGRLGPLAEASSSLVLGSPGRASRSDASLPAPSAAARALADQCLRALSSRDAARREQAARHLAAVPLASAAPLLAQALGDERDPRARAQLARALAACGGEAAAEVVAQLQAAEEPALVRLAALEALCAPGGARALAALDAAARDPSPAVRRRAAALASGAPGAEPLVAALSADSDATVRAASSRASEVPEIREIRGHHTELPAEIRMVSPELPPRDVEAEVVLAVQAAMFGLTEAELADTLGLAPQELEDLAARLVAAGRLGRRGKRLVAAQGA